jgi:hypothetical protein
MEALIVPNYIARVELHRADGEDYETLHDEMKKRGFSRTITSDEENTFKLPTGTYVVEATDENLQTVLKAATEAAQATGKSSWIIATDWTKARFNLQRT